MVETHLPPETKYLPGSPLAVATDGAFEGYASLFGAPDLGRDVVAPGAFADSLARRGAAGIRMLWQHDPAEPVGRWLSLVEDARGLAVRGRLNLGVRRAREIAALLEEGAIDGLSIGFRTVEAVRDRRTGLRRLLKLDLWEISIVTFPMLPGARVPAPRPPLPDGRGRVPAAAGIRVRVSPSVPKAVPHPDPLPFGRGGACRPSSTPFVALRRGSPLQPRGQI